jgi:histidinol-phosphate aminotransferase
MSRFFSSRNKDVTPYTPGEQPKDMQYIKLNTNENPFPPSPEAARRAAEETLRNNIYSDPRCTDLVAEAAEVFGLDKDQLLFTNGSDEILDFAVRAFGSESYPIIFPDISYGFYSVFASIHGLPSVVIPLTESFEIDLEDYKGLRGLTMIANPNAPTGIAIGRDRLEAFIAEDPDRLVLVDEAYVDFGGESCVPLVKKYDNLIVTQTFSKSRSMAGARLGMGFACRELIAEMDAIKYSTNPYNVNRMTMAAGIGALKDREYFEGCCREICRVRDWFTEELKAMGFEVLPSCANFVFAKSSRIGGNELYLGLKERGILVRHFETERLKDWNRISIGTEEQMRTLVETLREMEA